MFNTRIGSHLTALTLVYISRTLFYLTQRRRGAEKETHGFAHAKFAKFAKFGLEKNVANFADFA